MMVSKKIVIFGLLGVWAGGGAFASQEAPVSPPDAVGTSAAVQASKLPSGEPQRVVMVRVGEVEIAVSDFMRYISQDSRLVRDAITPEGKARIVRAMISDLLLQRAMREEGVVDVPDGQPITGADFGKGMAALQERHFPMPPPPSEEEAKAFYDANKGEYGIPETVRLSQIQFRFPDGIEAGDEAAQAATRERAEKALGRLQAGESFEALAGELTDNPRGKVAGGDLGFLPLGQSAWLDGVVKDLKAGEHTGVVRSPSGFELLKVTERREPITMPYSNVRDHVMDRIQRDRQSELLEKYVSSLAARTPIEIVQDGLTDVIPGR